MMADVISRRSLTSVAHAIVYSLTLIFIVSVVSTAEGAGVRVHQYLFNDGTANDSIGTANGTLHGTASIAAGSLVLDGSAGATVDLLSSGANGININTLTSGLTLEAWATPSSLMTGYHTMLGFGQVNTTDPNFAANYLILQTHRGDNVSRAALSISNDATPFGEEDFANGTELNDNKKHFYAVTLTTTTISLYTDGTLNQTATYPVNGAANMISGISNQFARIGTAYPIDPLWRGTIGQVDIWNGARSGLQVAQDFNAGEIGPLGPTLTIDRATGAMTLTDAQEPQSVVGYSVTSPAGSLNQAAWLSITDNYDSNSGGSFDNNNKWTKLSAAGGKTDFSEFEFDGGDGGVLGAGGTTSMAIGSAGAWRRSIYEDLQVQLRLNNGTALPVAVVYTGNGGIAYKRSDLNFDGAINVSDWNIFLANNGGTFSNMSAAESYSLGDENGDGVNNRLDFRIFKADYVAVNGAGAWDALPGVPEPSTIALLGLACATTLVGIVRRGLSRCVCSHVSLLSIVAVLAAIAGRADAAAVHRYSFSEGVTADASNRVILDSIGGASGNGVVKGAGSSATVPANGVGGQLTLAGGPSTTAAYVDLPNGLVSGLTDATFESWYTISSAQSWARVLDFGSTDTSATPPANVGAPGELLGPGGGGNGQDNLFYAPSRGTNLAQQRTTIANQDALFKGASAGNVGGGFFDLDTEFTHVLNTQYHANIVYNSNGAGPGLPTLALYINGVLAPQQPGDTQLNPFPVGHTLGNLNDVNNWLGRSNWTVDMNFAGSFNEFRIYNTALTDSQIATNDVLGPDILGDNVVSLTVNTGTGEVKIKNLLSVPLQFDDYEVTSAGGALSTAGWTSIDGNGPLPGAGWDKSGTSNANHITELYLPAAGYTLPANGEISIGNAYNPAIFGSANNGDLAFGFGLLSGAFVAGQVSYIIPVGVPGDYNGNLIVDAADYTVWRDHLGQTFTLPNRSSLNSGPISQADYTFWKSRFGATGPGSGGGVPELSTLALSAWGLMVFGLLVACRATSKAMRKIARGGTSDIREGVGQAMATPVVALLVAALLATWCHAAATPDRFYQFGDDPLETKVLGQRPSTFGGNTLDSATIPTGPGNDFQDLTASGTGPLYVNTQSTARPGAQSPTEYGLSFNGTDDSLARLNGGLGSPAVAQTDPSYAGPPQIVFTGITTRLIDGWVRPGAVVAHRQDIVNDTGQFGVFISADNHWGLVEGTTTVTSTISPVVNQWTHVMHRTSTNDTAVLYVNGVAVAGTTNDYNTTAAAANLVFGASLNQSTNFFQGQMDNFKIFVAGDNSGTSGGKNYGTVNLATDNDFIRQAMVGKPAGDVDLSGSIGPNDVTVFVANWLKTKQVGGVTVGDITTRAIGDLNFNGIVDIDDAYVLHHALVGAGAGALDASLVSQLGLGAPEPSSIVLALFSLAGIAGFCRRRGRRSRS